MLPLLIGAWTGQEAEFAATGTVARAGGIYVCPPQHHVLVNPNGVLEISAVEKLAFVRPSVDWLFETVAASYGFTAIAVVLSGANSDGSYGVRCIAHNGGSVIVQDPATCEWPQMPLAAIATGVPHTTRHPREIAAFLYELAIATNRDRAEAWREPFGESVSPM